MQYFFLYISLPLFCTTSTKEKSYMFLHSIFFISLLLILTLLAANICHFLIAALNFSFAMNLVYFLFLFLSSFVFRSSSFSVIGVSVVVVGGERPNARSRDYHIFSHVQVTIFSFARARASLILILYKVFSY